MQQKFDFFFQWHLTERCNLRCRHCYQERSSSGELTGTEIAAVLDEITETLAAWAAAYDIPFSPSFNITGGEPFLRQDLFEILGAIKAAGYPVYLLTNGTLIDRERALRLAALGIDGVQVSLEGPEEVHDAIRGRGSFRAAEAGIRRLVGAGIEVTVNSTLSALNAGRFPELAPLVRAMGVRRLGFSRLVPAGQGKSLAAWSMTRAETGDLYRRLWTLEVPDLELVTGDPVDAQLRDPNPPDETYPCGGCAAGFSGITLLADGSLIPCRRLPLSLGNLRRDSLREIWAGSEVLGALRSKSRYSGRCRDCRRWAACRGCRAIAYAVSGDFLAEDPHCFL